MSLSGRVAIVTGATRGIGKAITLALAKEGANIVVAARNQSLIDKMVEEVKALGMQAIGVRVDVSRSEEVQRMVDQTLAKFGKIDILVNNAGVTGRTTPITELTEEEWDSIMNVDLKGVYLCSKAVVKHMIQRKTGNILNISSIAGKEGNAFMTHYSAAKGGVITFTKALAEEVVSHGIRVNCLTPALIETDILQDIAEEKRAVLISKIPMGRLGKPEEVASAAKFLVSDEASFITGQCINVSGGRGKY